MLNLEDLDTRALATSIIAPVPSYIASDSSNSSPSRPIITGIAATTGAAIARKSARVVILDCLADAKEKEHMIRDATTTDAGTNHSGDSISRIERACSATNTVSNSETMTPMKMHFESTWYLSANPRNLPRISRAMAMNSPTTTGNASFNGTTYSGGSMRKADGGEFLGNLLSGFNRSTG